MAYFGASIVVSTVSAGLLQASPAQAQPSDLAISTPLDPHDTRAALNQILQAKFPLSRQAKFLDPAILDSATPDLATSIELAQTPETSAEIDEIGQAEEIAPEPDSGQEITETGETDEVPTIRITVTEKLLNQPVFTPFRLEATLQEAPQPVYVINRDQIEAQGARTVDEALRFLPTCSRQSVRFTHV
jgi:outer membrane receptor protein involved in Fe transport